MSEALTILRHSPVYLAASLLNRGGGFLLVLVYTHFLNEAGYGLVGAAMAAAEVIGVLLSLQLVEALARLFFDHQDGRGRSDVVATALIALLGLIALAIGPLLLLAPALASFVAGDPGAADSIVLATLAVGFDAVFNAGLQTLRTELRSGAVLVWSAARTLMLVVASGLLVGVMGYGALGALAGLLSANATLALALSTTLLVRGGRFRWVIFRALVSYGAPLCPAWASDAAAKFVERAAIVQYSGLGAAGLWYLAVRLAELLTSILHAPFVQVFGIRRLELHRDGTPDLESPGLFSVFFAVMAWGAVALSALAPEVVALVSQPDFAPAASLVPAAAAAATVFSLATFVELRLSLAKRPGRITFAVAIAALMHAGVAWLCSAYWGLIGVAWARLGATCFRVACIAVSAQGLPGPGPQWWRILGITLLAIACFVALYLIAWFDASTSLAARLAIVVAFPLLVLITPLSPPVLRKRRRQTTQ